MSSKEPKGGFSTSIALIGAVLGVAASAVGLWLKWPEVKVLLFPPPAVTYGYMGIPGTSLECVAVPGAIVSLDSRKMGLLQNECQADVVAGYKRNEIFGAWYMRIHNGGGRDANIVILHADGRVSKSYLGDGEEVLVCLGFDGRQGRDSLSSEVVELQLVTDGGDLKESFPVRALPPPTQMRSADTNCIEGSIVGYPPFP